MSSVLRFDKIFTCTACASNVYLQEPSRKALRLPLDASQGTPGTLIHSKNPLARSDLRCSVDASVARAGRSLLRLVARGSTFKLGADFLDIGSTGARDRSGVTKVGVDASKELTRLSNNVLDDDVALCALLAVSARAVELAEVDDGEAVDGDSSGAVVLDDLVFSASGTTAGHSGITVTLE
jgi:hypothetical protein